MLLGMAFARVLVLFSLLLMQPLLSKSDGICDEVNCGKGTCVPSANSNNTFTCQCDKGWKRTYGQNETGMDFLPCVIPNCTVNYTCSNTSAPAPAAQIREISKSIFDVCHWVECGAGSCVRISLFHHKCECDAGYLNLLNTTSLPCVKPCSLGVDCAALGLVGNETNTSPSDASSIVRGSSFWLLMMIMVMTKLIGGLF